MTTVKVASKNLVKLEAIRQAFSRYFKEVKIISKDVESGVSAQPVNQYVFQGARNRLEALKDDSDFNYLVSCEGGLISFAEHWFNVQIVMIEDQHGNQGIGMSQGYEIPHKYIEEAINTSVADVLDRIFDGRGGISVLTHGHETRQSLIQDGTIMALAKVLNSEIW